MPDLLVRCLFYSPPACLSALLYPAELLLLLGSGPCLDSVLRAAGSVTRVIQSAQLGRFKRFCAFHRFFSRARWNLR